MRHRGDKLRVTNLCVMHAVDLPADSAVCMYTLSCMRLCELYYSYSAMKRAAIGCYAMENGATRAHGAKEPYHRCCSRQDSNL